MICPKCSKQIPDDSDTCKHCGASIDHKQQVSKEISFRRYQRWIFYAIIVLVFAGMVGIIIRIYNANSEISQNMASIQKKFQTQQEELQKTEDTLKETKTTLEQKTQAQKDLEQRADNLKSQLENYNQNYNQVQSKFQDCQLNLDKANSNIYKLIVELGKGVSNNNLAKIPLADSNLAGQDSDNDGLSDLVEQSLGTNLDNSDTDGDSYTDKEEILKGFNPVGEGKLPLDEQYAAQMKGNIFLQVDGSNEAWYVAGNGKRYFLGTPANAFKTMREVEYWTENPPNKEENATSSLSL